MWTMMLWALAQGPVDVSAPFARFPCSDGWASCSADDGAWFGTHVVGADLRVGWHDLEPSPSFSPFAWFDHIAPVPPPSAPAAAPVRVAPPSAPAAPVRVAPSPAVVVPPPVEPPAPLAVEVPQGCDVEQLLTVVRDRRLTADERGCLVGQARSESMRTRREASSALLSEAQRHGTDEEWLQHAIHHLDHVDASNPDIAYRAAYLRHQQGAEPRSVVRWATLGLENRFVWTGDVYRRRVVALHRMRTEAAVSLWQQAESTHATTPGQGTAEASDSARTQAKVLAREYLETAVAVGRDVERARALCRSAAGHDAYCETTSR